VVVKKADKDWFWLVVLAGQDVGCLDNLFAAGHGVNSLFDQGTLQDWEEKFDVELLHDVLGVAVVAVDGDVEDPGAAGSVVLLDVVDPVLHVVDDAVLVLDLLLELGIFFLSSHEKGLQLVEAGVGVTELANNRI